MPVNISTVAISALIIVIYCRITSAKNATGICRIGVPLPDGKPTSMNVCCTGFQQKKNSVNFECETMCPKGCENGNCTGPNICTCIEGYVMGPKQKCIPTCPAGCLNGACYRSKCHCSAGYVYGHNEQYCVPHCPGGCGAKGTCIGPRACRCDKGYQINTSTQKCEPNCVGGCGTGGTCTSPNNCTCHRGYKLVHNKCTPHCDQTCINGFCFRPNVCACNPGYLLDSKNWYKCVPYCPKGCKNGTCIAPYLCAIDTNKHTAIMM